MHNFYHVLNGLELGDRIVVPKSSFNVSQHHAIYLAFVEGQHWIIENQDGYGVHKVNDETFFNGVSSITRIEKFHPRVNYDRNDLLNYALSLEGTPYNLLTYNCEHFANAVQHGEAKSHQVRNVLGAVGIAAALLIFAGIASSGRSGKKRA